MDRRNFIRVVAGTGGLAAVGGTSLVASCLADSPGPVAPVTLPGMRLHRAPVVPPLDLTLVARPASAEVGPGVTSPIFTWGDGPVGPTIEARRGDRARIVLRNELDQPTIAHWHGFRPPQEADGHPRFAIGSGAEYRYDFTIDERAGLYWYHPHPHMRTANQTYFGLVGLILVRDDEEDALGLPSGDREIAIALQDKRRDASGRLAYAGMGPTMMEGFLGDECYANGVAATSVEVDSALYRVRLLNGTNARIYRVALSNGAPMTLIGNDGGLLPAPVEVPYVDMGTGERVDLLVDFSGLRAGTTVSLRSLEFTSPARGMGMGMMRGRMGGMGAGGLPQGAPMRLLDFVVTRDVAEGTRIPAALPPLAARSRADADRQRTFRFASMMMNHTINGRSFQVDRIDERVPFGATEVWSFVNDGPFPHPVHMHAAHFQVLGRVGGRGQVFPWERGLKDTVLVFPGERVDVLATFDRHPGLFLLHCHNLEHEDMGMMLNFLIE